MESWTVHTEDVFATFVSNESMDNYPSNSSSFFFNLCANPLQLDPTYTYCMGVCSISYADTFKPKDPKVLETTINIPTEPPIEKYFTPSSGDNIVLVSEKASVIWMWDKGEMEAAEFLAYFLTGVNLKFGTRIRALSVFDEHEEPNLELSFTDEENIWTLEMSEELANVMGMDKRVFKPGLHTSKPFNIDLYNNLPADAKFRMELFKYVDKRIEIDEPEVHDMNVLLNDIATQLLENNYFVTINMMDGYVKLELVFDETTFKINFPPVVSKFFNVPDNYFFEESKNIFIFDKDGDESKKSEASLSEHERFQIVRSTMSDILYLHCSLVEPSIFGGNIRRIIRSWPRKSGINQVHHHIFTPVQYHPLTSSLVRVIDFSITDSTWNPIKQNSYPTEIVVNIKKVPL
jgi:hypothetical protein